MLFLESAQIILKLINNKEKKLFWDQFINLILFLPIMDILEESK